jgi:hypothetical protein
VNNSRKDDELIKILRQFPSIEDKRSMEEVYLRLQSKKENTRKHHLRNKKFLWPSIATIAVLFLSLFLVITQYNQQKENKGTPDKFEIAQDDSSNQTNEQKAELFHSFEDDSNFESNNKRLYQEKHAIYKNDVHEEDFVVTIGIPDTDVMNIVPISVIVNKDRGSHWIDYYNYVYENIDEEELGLYDYYPYKGTLKKENNQITLDLLADHQYDSGTSKEEIFFKSLNFFKYQNVDTIFLKEEANPGVNFSHTGKIYEYQINNTQSGYLIYSTNNYTYFTPSPNEYESIEDALLDMKKENQIYNLHPSIPNQFNFTVDVSNTEQLVLIFHNNVHLKENHETIRMIEAILLTAKEYGFDTVQFKNTNVKNIGPFDLEHPIQVPIAPNPVQMDMLE